MDTKKICNVIVFVQLAAKKQKRLKQTSQALNKDYCSVKIHQHDGKETGREKIRGTIGEHGLYVSDERWLVLQMFGNEEKILCKYDTANTD